MFGYEDEKWTAHFWFVGWDCLSLGFHICTSAPNIEIHLPFGFIRIGRKVNKGVWPGSKPGWNFYKNINMR